MSDNEIQRKPISHIRIIGTEDHIYRLLKLIPESLQKEYEILEVTHPLPIFGQDVNKKAYISLRDRE